MLKAQSIRFRLDIAALRLLGRAVLPGFTIRGQVSCSQGLATNFKVRVSSCQQRSTIEETTFSFPVIGTTKLTYVSVLNAHLP